MKQKEKKGYIENLSVGSLLGIFIITMAVFIGCILWVKYLNG
jgi:hypothetical protein